MPSNRFLGQISDDHQFDNEWCWMFTGFCVLCQKAIVQKIRFQKEQVQIKPNDEFIELHMFEALKRNHDCLKQLVTPGGERAH